jgi:hypothetical protein
MSDQQTASPQGGDERGVWGALKSLVANTSLIGIGLYALGIIAVNAFLAPFGVTEFSLFRAQLVYTGLLLLVPLAATFLCVETGRRLLGGGTPWRRSLAPFRAGRGTGTVVGGVFAFGLYTIWQLAVGRDGWSKALAHGLTLALSSLVVVRVLELTVGTPRAPKAGEGRNSTLRRAWRKLQAIPIEWTALVLALAAAVAAPGAYAIWARLPAAIILLFLLVLEPADGPLSRATQAWAARDASALVALAVVVAVASTAYLSKFVDDVYPVVPAQFGGGEPVVATLVFAPAGADQARAAGIPLGATSAVSSKVSVVFQGSGMDLICLPTDADGRVVGVAPGSSPRASDCITADHLAAIQLDRRIVSAVVMEGHGR